MRTPVIAGTYAEFIGFLRHYNLPQNEYWYVDRIEQIEGLHEPRIIATGRYWVNPVWYSDYLTMIQPVIEHWRY